MRRQRARDADDADAFREAVLRRANYRCQGGPIIATEDIDAARRCTGEASEAHHIEPRGMGGGGDNSPENGIALCVWCHRWAESNRKVAYRLGLLRKHGKPSKAL